MRITLSIISKLRFNLLDRKKGEVAKGVSPDPSDIVELTYNARHCYAAAVCYIRTFVISKHALEGHRVIGMQTYQFIYGKCR